MHRHGSALAMRYDGEDGVSVTLGSLDDPGRIAARAHIVTAERLPLVACVDAVLPAHPGFEAAAVPSSG